MASERAVPSDLFPLVLGFLRENHFDGAARAFKKAAGVTEQDPNAASLLDIFSYWLKSPIAKKQQAFANGSPAKKTKKESLSRYKSSSENEIPPVKKQAAKPVTLPPIPIKATPGSSESSSADTSDSTDSEQEGKKPAKKGIVLQSTIQKTKPQETSQSSSSDSSSSEDETPKHQPPKSGGAPKVVKLASISAKPTHVMSKTTNGKAESSSSSGEMSSSEDSSSEENQPVKGKLKKLPHCKNNTAQPLPVKTKHVKKSNSETSCDSSEHEKLASKPKRGEYSAVPPPLATESRKGKAHLIKKILKKKEKNNEKKKQVFTKRPSTQGSVIKKAFALKSLPVSIQKGNTSLGSDSESSSEEEKKVLVKCSAKAFSANCAAKSVPSKKVSSSSDTSDFDSSDSIPEKFAVRTGINKIKKPLGVLAKKVESSVEDKKVHKIKDTKAVKTTPKSSTPVSKPKTSESSSEEQTQPSQKAANKLSVGSSSIISKQAPAEIRTSSESSTNEQFKISDKREKKRGQNNCKIAKKVLKTSANFVGKTSKTPTSEVLSSANSSNSDEEATKEGLSKKKRKRKGEQELETPDIKKMKVRSPHTFPKSKQQSSPFRRIRTEEIEIDVRVANNSFDAKKGAIDDWGKKANDVLKFTKGKSFRHEKTKKKRGSYCGGTISTQINSIKFESD
ncbi:nucleolar and coiled-body phosphoprotein 1 [Pseudonaja textilis]|uniref:Nucleolar and coiled-body phosphoprotein 1 n=1 Tax=Pseudonaja textilis TaxID=8673 RepID=A0A670Y9K5_PSETE|nr:nucleolar and coiled-body phosphoprotein 1 [Pseudonaja textilis]